jgi:ribosomal protein L14E/L6E/L27E
MKTNRRLFPRAVASLFVIASLAVAASAQLRTPRPSPKASAMQTVGVTDITIIYSRPGVKNRTIWGDAPAGATTTAATLDDARTRAKDAPIVPYGHVWRTGANEATQFIVTDDVLINGQPLKAGTYSLHSIPGRDEWTIIFNSDAGQWGSFTYDEKKDVLRVKTKPQTMPDSQEWLTFSIDPEGESAARVNIRWERLRVPFTVEVKDVKALTVEKMRATVAAAKPDDWRTPLQAANYVFNNKLSNTDEAMQWLDKSLKTKETFNNLYTKARVLAEQGKSADAVATAEKALQMAKAPNSGVDAPSIADLEKRMADWKAKM